ncbi:helix-turn-helix domain-containing protein [Burkholderia cepacia]|uniref:AlbA family DNA-binding domain-containing protein n=1 Tax=Burkholderia cepacia TaxID=292 RepID=UPI0009C161FD|nr:ATP-binding protein [Burkholderia cepacia]
MEYTEELLSELVTTSASESESLEFKQELPRTKTPDDKAEFVKDVVGMANASGGTILYGIAEVKNSASRIISITTEPFDHAVRRLQETLISNVEPKELGVRFREIKVGCGYVLELTIPRSFAGPHRVLMQGQARSLFHVRSNTQVREFTHRELRDAFLGREHATVGFRNWRRERVSTILSGRGSRPLHADCPLAVLHAAPLEVFERSVSLDPRAFYQEYEKVLPRPAGSMSSNFNLDGVVTFSVGLTTERTGEYAQVFRTGQVELVFKGGYEGSRGDSISAPYIAQNLRKALEKYAALFRNHGFSGPIVFAFSLLRVSGFALIRSSYGDKQADRPELLLPEVLVSNADDVLNDVDATARPILDMLWQCFDIEKCSYFEPGSGRFVPPT